MSNTSSSPRLSRRTFQFAALLAALGASQASWAQNYPVKPVRLVVPFPPGGGTDMVARALGQKLSERLGQPVVVDNRPGAATIIGTEAVVKSAPDGYSMLLSGSTSFTVNPALRANLPYDPVKDLAPLAIVARAPLALVVAASAPWRSTRELVAAARAKPRDLRYATFGSGSGPHLAGELFALAAGVELQDVPYKGSSQATLAVMAGEIEIGIDTVATIAPHVKSGKLRVLGIVGATRSSLLPDVATLSEQGWPEATFDAWYGFAVPVQVPAPIQQRLVSDLQAVAADPALQAQLRAQGMEPVQLGQQAFAALMQTEIARYRNLAQRARIVAE
ncbi:Bug family tripartite tricarboxylate transporter substrate binding protein [Hylemonella sp. W303a]|uniref:Bug family tripartite tricarboxylate transporter substrate binding protein n=1 Tax=Hylemonella sp. W303a TaxID=3389873 RepID=UPI00396AF9E1